MRNWYWLISICFIFSFCKSSKDGVVTQVTKDEKRDSVKIMPGHNAPDEEEIQRIKKEKAKEKKEGGSGEEW